MRKTSATVEPLQLPGLANLWLVTFCIFDNQIYYTFNMEAASRSTLRQLRSSKKASRLLFQTTGGANLNNHFLLSSTAALNRVRRRNISSSRRDCAPDSSLLSFGSGSSSGNAPTTYFSNRSSLPANTIIRFVPQQTAWIVERMGKFHRILEPGLAILVPFIDRIAYVKSLKESAIEIPSQNAITADNVTLELDGVLYTRVVDAYKARLVHFRSTLFVRYE